MKKLIIIVLVFFVILLVKAKVFAEEIATPEGDAVREAVQQKIEEAQNKPTSYLGTVTDIVENTIQIKSVEGDIKQVAVDGDTELVKINSTSTKIKFSDIAIGDFLVNMGYKNGDSVLMAKRILVTSPPEKPDRKSVYAQVSKVTKSELEIKLIGSEETLTASPEKNVFVTQLQDGEEVKLKFSDIEEGHTILAVGTQSDETFSARSIQIAEQPATQQNSEEPSQ